MPSNARKSPRDAARIDFRHEHEIRYWCQYFACTTEQLIDCVNIVGFEVANVGRYLGKELQLVAGAGGQRR